MDIKRHSRTFQSERKTLSDVANVIGQPYGLQIAVQDNPVLPRMLYQHEETDWQFLVRLAETTGHFLFTNCASDQIQLSLGFVPFSRRELAGYDRIKTITLPVSTCRKVKENIRPKEGCRPTAEEELRRTNMPQQLTGTILAVEGTNVKVKFDCDEHQAIEDTCWIPYENTVNNYQYSMPDVGDHVFVYYESIYENPGQHLGRRWLINVGSCLERRDNRVRILCADIHLEKLQENTIFARVYDKNGSQMKGGWMMRRY
ncbi:hypothetical protein SAMN05216584_1117 [Selenomonas sp. WCT3]|uniref:hypothetical protein n=1 Tax=Selenomonas sp. WCT3 TaxID=3158785 RepID=UPI00088A063B|nr:hypothetical protein SAMN05216584_1117 [Selenomonas ruminantium]